MKTLGQVRRRRYIARGIGALGLLCIVTGVVLHVAEEVGQWPWFMVVGAGSCAFFLSLALDRAAARSVVTGGAESERRHRRPSHHKL